MGMTLYQIASIMYRREPESLSSDSDPDSPRQMIRRSSGTLSDLEKLVIEAENIYNVVKVNGLKSSIYYQIGIIQPREPGLKTKCSLECIKEEEQE